MSNRRFQVIINGELAEGAEPDQAKQNIARLFKTKSAAVEAMFSGKRISVKKNLDQATARKYQQAIIKAGLKAGIAPMAKVEPSEKKSDISAPSENEPTSVTLAATGCTMDERPQPAKVNIDTSAYAMDEVGITLDESPQAEAPEIDTTAYNLDEAGIILDETPQAEAAEIDVSEISIQERGADLMEYEAPPEAEYDLSQFSMAAAGETLVEHTPVPPANIDTSRLEMNKP